MAAALQVLDLLADDAGLLLGVPGGRHRHLLAGLALRAQRLAEPALVVGDEMGGCGKNMGGRAVVALQADHPGAREVLLEAQDVVDLGAAPAIDRLVVVAAPADVLEHARRCRRLGVLPLPVLHGERVRVRGTLQMFSPWRAPLTRLAASAPLRR